jgi:hypothetical protein
MQQTQKYTKCRDEENIKMVKYYVSIKVIQIKFEYLASLNKSMIFRIPKNNSVFNRKTTNHSWETIHTCNLLSYLYVSETM